MNINNPPAFPFWQVDKKGDTTANAEQGMTLRDWFAGMAMQGILTRGMNDTTQWDNCNYQQIAWLAYQLADCMLLERSKPTT